MEGYNTHSHSHSRTFSKKAYTGSNGFFTAYDEVYGGPPKFVVNGGGGIAAFAPRAEDYSEIFGTFHSSSSRISSIPILDLPPVDDSIASFDVSSSKFDYGEVFRGFEFVEIGVPFDELFKQSDGGDYSSDEAWTPAGVESLSDESDPSACSEKNEFFLKGNFDEPFHCKQFNVNCHKVNLGPMEAMPNIVHVDQIKAIPGCTYLVDQDFSLEKTGNERVFSGLAGDIVSSEDSSEDLSRKKQLKKMPSHPAYASSDVTPFENAHKPARDHGDRGSNIGSGFISISEIGPRTEPSHLAPSSRAPPIQTDDKQGSGTSSSDQKASKGYASESTFDDSLPPFFDVEVDASSSAAASAAAMKDAMMKAQAKLKCAKELMDKKKDGRKIRNNQGMKKEMDEGMSRMVSDELVLEDDWIQGIHESEHNKKKAGDEESSKIVFDECNTKKTDIEARSRMFSDEEAPDNKIMQGPCESEHSQKKKNGVGKLRKVSDKHTSKKENIEARDDNKRTISQKVNEAVTTAPHDLQNLARVEYSSAVALEPAEGKHPRNHSISAEAAGEWKEASEYFELVDSDISTTSFDPPTDLKSMVPGTNEHHLGKRDEPSDACQVLEQHDPRVNSVMNFCKLDENEQDSESDSHACQPEMNRWRLKATTAVSRHEYHAKMAKVAQEVHEREICHHIGVEDWLKESWESNDQMRKLKGTCEPEMNESKSGQNAGNVRKQNVVPMLQEGERRRTEALVLEENTKKVKEAFKTENSDIKVTRESCGRDENQKRMETALEKKGNQQTVEGASEKDENYISMQEIREHQEDCRRSGKTEMENEMTWTEFIAEQNIDGQTSGACERDIDAKKLDEAEDRCESEKTFGHAVGSEGYEKILKETVKPSQKRLDETCEPVTCYKDFEEVQNNENDVLQQEEFPKNSVQIDRSKKALQAHKNVGEEELTIFYERAGKFDVEPGFPLGLGVHINAEHLKASSGTFDLDIDEFEQNFADFIFKKPCSVAEAFKVMHGPKDYRDGTETLDAVNNEEPTGAREGEDDVSHLSERFTEAASEALSTSSDSTRSSDIGDGSRQTVLDDHKVPGPSCVKDMDHEQVGRTNVGEAHCSTDWENGRNRSVPTEKASNGRTETVQNAEARQPVMPEKEESFQKKSHLPKMNTERRGKSNGENLISEEKDKADKLSREMELEKERLQKLEEEREREREREKDRMAYAESRERTERASVEKAAAEARQRAMTEARERLEKACAEARGKSFVEKTSAEARLRAERAAVERATAEARERAIEKAMAERAVFDSRERLERSSSEKFSSSARDTGFRQSSFSFNNEKYDGMGDESVQRCRARLERHRRTVDRVAKALAEKNTRDLIAQREQAERNRLAETLDADVKRWSSGKEGNLRALISTLQYILGPESGWQPIPLTEVITSAAVKKAYRKATLCVHPDKLQQRGATIQQKYICEKVFDLLKAAWNKFNSEER